MGCRGFRRRFMQRRRPNTSCVHPKEGRCLSLNSEMTRWLAPCWPYAELVMIANQPMNDELVSRLEEKFLPW